MDTTVSNIRLTYDELFGRVANLKTLFEFVLNEKWLTVKTNGNTQELRLSIQNQSGTFLRTKFDDFVASYYEEWRNFGEKSDQGDLWSLETAYFSLYKRDEPTASYNEFLLLHCWEGNRPDEKEKVVNPVGYKQQQQQEKYQRSIHLHLKCLNEMDGNYRFISKSHLAITLGRQPYNFDSIESLSLAMRQSILLVKEEILDYLP